MIFNKKAVVNISVISNLKNQETFMNFVSRDFVKETLKK